MKVHTSIALVLIAAMSFASKPTSPSGPRSIAPLVEVEVEGRPGVIFPEERGSETAVVGKVAGYWTPSREDVEEAERGLRLFLERAHADPRIAEPWLKQHPERAAYVSREIGKIIENFDRFRRQYVGVVVGKSKTHPSELVPGSPDRRERSARVLEGAVRRGDGWRLLVLGSSV